MRYRIAYDEPGRLRVRFGPDAFTLSLIHISEPTRH